MLSRHIARVATRTPLMARNPMMGAQARNLMIRSTPRLGHNLEDHFDIAEYVMKMQGPFPEYLVGFLGLCSCSVVLIPFLHSNYYFTGRFLPKDQGNTQLCDNSW